MRRMDLFPTHTHTHTSPIPAWLSKTEFFTRYLGILDTDINNRSSQSRAPLLTYLYFP